MPDEEIDDTAEVPEDADAVPAEEQEPTALPNPYADQPAAPEQDDEGDDEPDDEDETPAEGDS